MSSQKPIAEAIYQVLYPKAAANYLSKLPVLQSVVYQDILDLLLDRTVEFPRRLEMLARYAGGLIIEGEVERELHILDLSLRGDEAGVPDPERQAFYKVIDAAHQKYSNDPRTRAYHVEHGVEVQLTPTTRNALRSALAKDQRDVPLFERVKAERLFAINSINGSRVLYIPHDLLDHPWLFTELYEKGVFKKYKDFLGSIDLTETTYLYSRQSELVASVGFGSRRWPAAKHNGEKLLLTAAHVDAILGSSDDPRCQDVRERFAHLAEEQQAWGLFVVENGIIQTADEWRRFGTVKRLNLESGQRGPMSLVDPLYFAFVLDSVMSLQTQPAYKPIQIATTMHVERLLEEIDENPSLKTPYIMHIPNADYADIPISTDKKRWIIENYSALTLYNKVS